MRNGFEAEIMVVGLIANTPGKLGIHKWRHSAAALKAACLKHCKSKWGSALPHLERRGVTPSNIWDLVLCTDVTLNYAGWIVSVDIALDVDSISHKRETHKRVEHTLRNLGVDRDVILLVSLENPPTYKQVVEAIKAAINSPTFLSVQVP